jgi:hypothetical protein
MKLEPHWKSSDLLIFVFFATSHEAIFELISKLIYEVSRMVIESSFTPREKDRMRGKKNFFRIQEFNSLTLSL